MLVFDLETDGLLDTVTKVQCLNLIDRSTGARERYTDHEVYADGSPTARTGDLAAGLRKLASAPLAGQNIIGYDLPVLKKLYGFETKFPVFDTRIASQVIWTNMADVDFGLLRAGKLPEEFQRQGLIGRHSLKAWGYRLGMHKGDFAPKDYGYTWETCPFLREMDDYCAQDCEVTLKWIEKIEAKNYSAECLELEHRVAQIIKQQELNGFAFDVPAAEKLYADLQKEKLRLEQELQVIFPPWEVVTKEFIAKVGNKKLGRVKGEKVVVKKDVIFNPGSRDHIADRLQKLRGWRPVEFTDNGKPKVDEEILSGLPYPEAKLLSEYLTVAKRLGQLGDGKEGWLKAVRNGRIHGQVNTNGAVTGRMTHSKPNVAQADKWKPMRSLWVAPPGKVLVGCDAEGLELRMLGHYMAAYDGGAYARTVVEGKKEDGTDVHTVNQRAAGLNNRDSSKTFISMG